MWNINRKNKSLCVNIFKCINLEVVNLPTSVTYIGEEAFSATPLLEELNLSNVQFIDECAFLGSGLKNIIGSSRYSFNNGMLIDNNFGNTKRIIYASSIVSNDLIIPSGVTFIADYAFYGNETIDKVNLNQVKYIGDSAFANATNLNTVIGNNVINADQQAFYGTPWYSNKSNMLILGKVLLSYTGNDKTITLEEVQHIILPSTLKEIGKFAFKDAGNLIDVIFQSTESVIMNESVFGDNDDVKLYIPASSYDNRVYHNDPFFTDYVDKLYKKEVKVKFVRLDDNNNEIMLGESNLHYYSHFIDIPDTTLKLIFYTGKLKKEIIYIKITKYIKSITIL